MNGEPMVTRYGALDMQVCVPADWTDEQVLAYGESMYPCGTEAGWSIRKEGSTYLQGSPERNPCSGASARKGYVHIMLNA